MSWTSEHALRPPELLVKQWLRQHFLVESLWAASVTQTHWGWPNINDVQAAKAGAQGAASRGNPPLLSSP